MSTDYSDLLNESGKAKNDLPKVSITFLDAMNEYQNDSGIQELLNVISDEAQEYSTYSCT